MSAPKDNLAKISPDAIKGMAEPSRITSITAGLSLRQQALDFAVRWSGPSNENYPAVVAAAKAFEKYLIGAETSE